MGKPTDLVQGTLDFLILKAIEHESKHGWAIAKRIQQISGDVLKVPQGSLYPALYRLENAGLVEAAWEEQTKGRRGARRRLYRLEKQGWLVAHVGPTDTGRQVKFYSLTNAGRTHLRSEIDAWERLSGAINLAIRAI